eukprot:scaffold284363_cov32-Tisochrysis_lutea.AAC.3
MGKIRVSTCDALRTDTLSVAEYGSRLSGIPSEVASMVMKAAERVSRLMKPESGVTVRYVGIDDRSTVQIACDCWVPLICICRATD